MTVVDNVFPQSGDADFAENFATWTGKGNSSSHVETGLSFTVDYAASPPTVDITEGKSYVLIPSKTISSNNETRLDLDYAITTAAESNLALNASESNNLVYLNPNIGTNDSPTFEVETSSGNAGATWLLIGVIDTVNNVSETRNRNPDADYNSLTAQNSFGLPTYSEFADASASESSTIYIDGAGTPTEGVYVHDGGEFISAGIREINELTDVTGVESIDSDASSDRAAAGTQGRLFVDETNNRIQIDNGSSWVDIGTNPSNIDATDLGFDTATQSELDTHTGTTDAHHIRPSAGNGLKESSNTFNFEPGEVSGTFISDDGSDNITVDIGAGLENDGLGAIRVDEDFDYTFTTAIDFSAGLDVQGDITDGTQLIWDVSTQEIPDSALGVVDAGTLDLGRGLEDDGTGSLQFDEDTDYTFTTTIDFNAGIDVQGDITDDAQTIWDVSAQEIPDSAMGSIDNTTLTNSSITVTAGTDLVGGGTVSLGGSTTVDHADTSTQANVSAVAGEAITDIDVDGNGHVTTLGTTSFDSRYVEVAGDTITGLLSMEAEFNANNASGGRVVLPVGTDKFAT